MSLKIPPLHHAEKATRSSRLKLDTRVLNRSLTVSQEPKGKNCGWLGSYQTVFLNISENFNLSLKIIFRLVLVIDSLPNKHLPIH